MYIGVRCVMYLGDIMVPEPLALVVQQSESKSFHPMANMSDSYVSNNGWAALCRAHPKAQCTN